jgi:hypothetical protein
MAIYTVESANLSELLAQPTEPYRTKKSQQTALKTVNGKRYGSRCFYMLGSIF